MGWTDQLADADAVLLDEFAEEIQIVPVEGAAFTVRGIPHNGSGTESVAAINVVRFWIRYEDLAVKPLQGDAALVDGADYLVAFVDVQTGGGAYLTLDRIR